MILMRNISEMISQHKLCISGIRTMTTQVLRDKIPKIGTNGNFPVKSEQLPNCNISVTCSSSRTVTNKPSDWLSLLFAVPLAPSASPAPYRQHITPCAKTNVNVLKHTVFVDTYDCMWFLSDVKVQQSDKHSHLQYSLFTYINWCLTAVKSTVAADVHSRYILIKSWQTTSTQDQRADSPSSWRKILTDVFE